MPIIIGILIFKSMINTRFECLEARKSLFLSILELWMFEISCSVELSMKQVYNLGASSIPYLKFIFISERSDPNKM